jgi:ribosomal protein L20
MPSKKKIKYLGVNLKKDLNNLYKENYKPLKKEIKEDCRSWKDLPCLWIGRINIVKKKNGYTTNTMLNSIPIKIPMTFITDIEKSKVHLDTQKTTNSQGNI